MIKNFAEEVVNTINHEITNRMCQDDGETLLVKSVYHHYNDFDDNMLNEVVCSYYKNNRGEKVFISDTWYFTTLMFEGRTYFVHLSKDNMRQRYRVVIAKNSVMLYNFMRDYNWDLTDHQDDV